MAEIDAVERDALRAKLVKELVDLGMDEWDAYFAVRLHLRETMGDVIADPPLTKEQYRAMGLDRDFLFDAAPELSETVRRNHRARSRSARPVSR
jgi:hypothetical protein